MLRHSLIVRLSLLCLVLATATNIASAQKTDDDKEKKYKKDPYTENTKEVWQAAGYEDMGSFAWADGHGTSSIEDAIGDEELIFIETKHFKIGSCLPRYTISRENKIEKKKIDAELKELRKIIPNIPKKVKVLDNWLRLHLYAMRAEKLYAQVQELLQVSDEDFPTGPGQAVDGKYMGEGPYLGMKSKFTLLFFDKESSIGRYRTAFMDQSGTIPIRHLFPNTGTLLYASAAQNDGLFSDTTMHCALVYALTQNLLNGYRHYGHSMPTWLPTGIGHYYTRQIDMKRNYFTDKRLYNSNDKNIWKWDTKARKRVDNDITVSYDEMTSWGRPEDLKYNDHVMAWARADFLIKEHPDWAAQWLYRMQERYPGAPTPSAEQMRERDHEVVAELFKFKKGTFDDNWQKWVKKKYSRK